VRLLKTQTEEKPMSVLTCPVCRGAMREMNKEGIMIDVCTQCRGVWLDRGELEKLANFMSGPPMDAAPPPRGQPYPDNYAYRDQHRGGEFGERGEYGEGEHGRGEHGEGQYGGQYGGQRRRSGMGRFLDFFD
jgi:uncharacterized protein